MLLNVNLVSVSVQSIVFRLAIVGCVKASGCFLYIVCSKSILTVQGELTWIGYPLGSLLRVCAHGLIVTESIFFFFYNKLSVFKRILLKLDFEIVLESKQVIIFQVLSNQGLCDQMN